MKIFDYFQKFNLNIYHIFDKQYIVFNALFRLIFGNISLKLIQKYF